MSQYSFDDFESSNRSELKDQKPIWAMDFSRTQKADEELLAWLKDSLDNLKKINLPRVQIWRENMALYKGIHYKSQDIRSSDYRRDTGDKTVRNPRIVINHVFNMVETKVAKMSRFKPAIAVIPNNNEWFDKCNTKTVKILVDSRWHEADMDELVRHLQRASYVFGHSYMKVFWNKDIGPEVPELKELEEMGIDLFAVNENGERILDREGKEIPLRRDARLGDVDYQVKTPDMVLFEERKNIQESTYCHDLEWFPVEEVRADYPMVEKIEPSSEFKFDLETMTEKHAEHEVMVVETHFRPTKYFPKGLIIKWEQNNILEIKEFPYKHKKLPYVCLKDIEVTNEMMGRSFIQNIKQPQRHFNSLASGVARNHGLANAPKWIMPAGSCRFADLGNDITVVEYKGPVPPRLESFSPTSPEVFNYMDKLKGMIMESSEITGLSMGQPPAGIRAGVALQFMDEQEQERHNNAVAKRSKAIREIFKMTAILQQQFYKDEDGRMIRIIGKDNKYLLRPFRSADLTTSWDIREQNSSALPETKTARIQSIIDLKMYFPTLLKDEQVASMLDLGTSDEFMDHATVAVKAMESENDTILSGQPTPEPKPWEDLIIHWKGHLKVLQERTFKEEVPTEAQAKLIEHMLTTEYLMAEKAERNIIFMTKLRTQCEQFPIFFRPSDEFMRILSGMPMDVPNGGKSVAPEMNPNSGLVPPAETGVQEMPITTQGE